MTHDIILRAVRGLPQMKDKTLIFLSITGSRSKQLDSNDSDYDLKAIILHSAEDYLLQNVTPSKSFSTHIVDPDTGNTVKTEGTLVDYLLMQDRVLKSHHAAYDALFGIPVYETPESERLKQLFLRAYDPRTLAHSFSGLGKHEQRKAEKNDNGRYGNKHAANVVYYAVAVHSLRSDAPDPPPQDAFSMLEGLRSIDPGLRERMKRLYEKRKADRSGSDVDLRPFMDFIRNSHQPKVPETTRRNEEPRALKDEAEKHFLKLFLK